MLKLVNKGPEDYRGEKEGARHQRPARPLSSAPDINPVGNPAGTAGKEG
jgi:hypothetical protein